MLNNKKQIESAIVMHVGHGEESEMYRKEINEVYEKAEAFDECLKCLEELKHHTANPHDVMNAYDNVISVLRNYLESEDE